MKKLLFALNITTLKNNKTIEIIIPSSCDADRAEFVVVDLLVLGGSLRNSSFF